MNGTTENRKGATGSLQAEDPITMPSAPPGCYHTLCSSTRRAGARQMEHSSTPANMVRTALRRLGDADEVVQVKKEWGLANWYPGFKRRPKPDDGGNQNGEGEGSGDAEA